MACRIRNRLELQPPKNKMDTAREIQRKSERTPRKSSVNPGTICGNLEEIQGNPEGIWGNPRNSRHPPPRIPSQSKSPSPGSAWQRGVKEGSGFYPNPSSPRGGSWAGSWGGLGGSARRLPDGPGSLAQDPGKSWRKSGEIKEIQENLRKSAESKELERKSMEIQ